MCAAISATTAQHERIKYAKAYPQRPSETLAAFQQRVIQETTTKATAKRRKHQTQMEQKNIADEKRKKKRSKELLDLRVRNHRFRYGSDCCLCEAKVDSNTFRFREILNCVELRTKTARTICRDHRDDIANAMFGRNSFEARIPRESWNSPNWLDDQYRPYMYEPEEKPYMDGLLRPDSEPYRQRPLFYKKGLYVSQKNMLTEEDQREALLFMMGEELMDASFADAMYDSDSNGGTCCPHYENICEARRYIESNPHAHIGDVSITEFVRLYELGRLSISQEDMTSAMEDALEAFQKAFLWYIEKIRWKNDPTVQVVLLKHHLCDGIEDLTGMGVWVDPNTKEFDFDRFWLTFAHLI